MRISKFLSVAALASGLCLGSTVAQAGGTIDARTFEFLNQAQQLAGDGRHDDALKILDRLKERGRLNSYATAQLWNFYAFIYASQEDFRKSIDAYKNVLKQEEATAGLKLTAKYTIGQLYFQLEQYDECIRFINEWLSAAAKPTPLAHVMLAQAYYQKQDMDAALSNVNKAIELEAATGKPIQESWLRMKAIVYYRKGDYANTAATYEQLISLYPKVNYMRQLAGMYSELDREADRLATFDAIYEYGGLDSEGDLLNLAYMWLGSSAPYKAGKIIEANMKAGKIKENGKNIETLANAWAQAQEYNKAVPALTRAAEMSGDGIFYARLAGVYFNAGDFAEAAAAARRADAKGGLKNPEGNLLLMGMAYFNQKDFENALQAFRRAKQDKKTFSAASKWESYTLKEVARKRALEQSQKDLYWKTHQALEATENNQEAIQLSN